MVLFGGREALGTTVRTNGDRDHTIIGVVPTGKYQRLGEPPTAVMYFANAQGYSSGLAIFIQTTGAPTALIPTLRAEVAALDRSLSISNPKSMDRHLGIALLPARLTGAVLGIFGLLGLALAAIGMYGVMAYSRDRNFNQGPLSTWRDRRPRERRRTARGVPSTPQTCLAGRPVCG